MKYQRQNIITIGWIPAVEIEKDSRPGIKKWLRRHNICYILVLWKTKFETKFGAQYFQTPRLKSFSAIQLLYFKKHIFSHIKGVIIFYWEYTIFFISFCSSPENYSAYEKCFTSNGKGEILSDNISF